MGRPKTPGYSAAGNAGPAFVSRWSRLKHASRRSADEVVDGGSNSDGIAGNEDAADRRSQSLPKTLTDADMPDIDSLTYDSAYKDFLSPGVSEQLRKLALRKLFHSEIFNIRDGLDEYDDDFTQFEKLGDTVTSDMRHQMEMEARRKAEQLLDQDEQAPDANSSEPPVQAGKHRVDHEQTQSGLNVTEAAHDDEQPRRAETAAVSVDTNAPTAPMPDAEEGNDHG